MPHGEPRKMRVSWCFWIIILLLAAGVIYWKSQDEDPKPPPSPRVVRFLNAKKPKPKLWAVQFIPPTSAEIDMTGPDPDDEGYEEYEFASAAKKAIVRIDVNGDDAFGTEDFEKTFTLSQPFVLIECTAIVEGGALKVRTFFGERPTETDEWTATVEIWP